MPKNPRDLPRVVEYWDQEEVDEYVKTHTLDDILELLENVETFDLWHDINKDDLEKYTKQFDYFSKLPQFCLYAFSPQHLHHDERIVHECARILSNDSSFHSTFEHLYQYKYVPTEKDKNKEKKKKEEKRQKEQEKVLAVIDKLKKATDTERDFTNGLHEQDLFGTIEKYMSEDQIKDYWLECMRLVPENRGSMLRFLCKTQYQSIDDYFFCKMYVDTKEYDRDRSFFKYRCVEKAYWHWLSAKEKELVEAQAQAETEFLEKYQQEQQDKERMQAIGVWVKRPDYSKAEMNLLDVREFHRDLHMRAIFDRNTKNKEKHAKDLLFRATTKPYSLI